jgi:hypothetical protein
MYPRPIASGSVVPAPLPVSAPRRVAEHLQTAPDGPVRVLHQVPTAVYVEVAGRSVGVVSRGAAQVPCALRVPGRAVPTRPGGSPGSLLAGDAVSPYVERGTLYLTCDPLVVGRFVDVRVPRIDPDRVLRRAASPATKPAAPPRTASDGLAAYRALPARVADALDRLVGHGAGLTPLGDDVVCGWLAVLHAAGRLDEATEAAVRRSLGRTTTLSATLLDCALHGEVLPEFAAYVSALGTPREHDAARALMAIGHTSGAGLWFGATHALTILAAQEAAA